MTLLIVHESSANVPAPLWYDPAMTRLGELVTAKVYEARPIVSLPKLVMPVNCMAPATLPWDPLPMPSKPALMREIPVSIVAVEADAQDSTPTWSWSRLVN